MPAKATLVVGVLLAMLVPAAADASPPSPPRISWAACGPRLECATVPVPLDWRHPGGPSIDLAVIRHLASRPGQRIGSLFLNPGGPGDSGVAAVAGRGEALDALTDGRFDTVGWDPRGSGGSAPVSCFAEPSERASFWNGLPVPTTRAEERRYLAKTIALAQRCGARNGRLLAHISTADTVRDLDHLRRLVGDRRLSFLGESTGTLIGQTYASLFPRRVRAMVLDGVEDPVRFTAGAAAALAQSFTDTDRTFEQFLALCQEAGPARQHARAWPHVVHRLQAISRIGAAPQGWAVGAPCASWPARPADRHTGPWTASTRNPVLLVGTRFDPNTPLVNARIAERRLGNAVLLTHDGYGHLSSADPSTCVVQATGRYLVDLTIPARGTVCPPTVSRSTPTSA
jgi:pimeloyl-ACP methyl ester carboxylesterase